MNRLAVVATVALALAACKKDAPRAGAAAAPATSGTVAADGTRTVPVAVKKAGYEPAALQAKANEHLILRFTRVEATECGAQVKVGDGKLYDLPMNQPVDVAVTAPASGKITFACGMDMMTGQVIVDG
ncbi:MAG: cupredoxin domain-containing protein [Kofleriaceae bacterium]